MPFQVISWVSGLVYTRHNVFIAWHTAKLIRFFTLPLRCCCKLCV
nr:MAG TPA: hypothetical protein [Caudoviricetes sp.]